MLRPTRLRTGIAAPAMHDNTQLAFFLPAVCHKKVTAAFDGGTLSRVGWSCGSRQPPLGLDVRCLVTNICHCGPQWLFDGLYCERGQAENLIKKHKSRLASDRGSCRSQLANQNAAGAAHRRLLADAHKRRRHPCAAATGPGRVLHHPRSFAEDRCQGLRGSQSGASGLRCELSRCGAVLRIAVWPSTASDLTVGARPRLANNSFNRNVGHVRSQTRRSQQQERPSVTK
jgi:Transposase DDE domain group 1